MTGRVIIKTCKIKYNKWPTWILRYLCEMGEECFYYEWGNKLRGTSFMATQSINASLFITPEEQ